jgi:uncharacterized membrane protein YhaH (DUF805 family)
MAVGRLDRAEFFIGSLVVAGLASVFYLLSGLIILGAGSGGSGLRRRGFLVLLFPVSPLLELFCLAAAGSRGVGKTSPCIADLQARSLCWFYVFGGICRCLIYGGKPCRNRRDEVGAGSAFGRLCGGWWVANLAVDRFSRSEAEPS